MGGRVFLRIRSSNTNSSVSQNPNTSTKPSYEYFHSKMNSISKLLLFGITLLCLQNVVLARCSFIQRVFVCNSATKSFFARIFTIAVNAPATGCSTMTDEQWRRVGCSSPARHQNTKVCAPAKWSRTLRQFATAIALQKKVLFKEPYDMDRIFNTTRGRSLMRHELTHIRQQDGVDPTIWGRRYINEYCNVGCSYRNNRYVTNLTSYP